MKKGGIIFAIIIIFILSLVVSGIETIKNELPKPKFDPLYDFRFDNESSTKTFTRIKAKLNISNEDNLAINISYNNSRCDVYYNNQIIGKISLFLNDNDGIKYFKGKTDTTKSPKKIFKIIKGKEKQNFSIFFQLLNENLSKMFYNHTMKNNEHGKIKFILNFTVKIRFPLDVEVPINRNTTIKIEKEIETDFLEKLEQMIYNKSLNETSPVIYPLKNSTFISMMKKSESNVIQFNYTTRRLKKIKPFLDLYIGDDLYWITNTQPLNIRIGQEMILYGKPVELSLFNKLIFPLKCNISLNNILFGNCTIQSVERRYSRTDPQRIEVSLLIDGDNFGEWIYSHIRNSETTIVNISFHSEKLDNLITNHPFIHSLIPKYGENYTVGTFNFTLSQLIGQIELHEISFDLSNIEKDLSNYQLLIIVIIINTIIVVVILYFAFWKKEKYLIFR
ncbi:MAG: hypothetical protein MUO82_00415 [Candidatus Thermoplasmatota archaeon]|nr:hypothetical protein [Candidatus Thermoplasmatota archaeon]